MGKLLDRNSTEPALPLLVEGDRLTLDEFWRRYEADTEVLRAELIDGVVYVNSRRVIVDGKEMIVPPISAEGHGRPQNRISTWLGFYSAYTPGVVASSPYSVRISNRNAPEPDALLEILPEFNDRFVEAGNSSLDNLPGLVVEIANTSVKRDLGPKFEAYQVEGISEYIVWQTESEIIDWFVLKQKKYVPLKANAQGILQSKTFPGLWLDIAAIRDSNMARVIDILKLGLASPEHAGFVAKLQANAKRK